jgi:hypothetical protein
MQSLECNTEIRKFGRLMCMHCCTLGLSRSYEGETASILIHVPSMIPQTQDQDSNIKNHDSIRQTSRESKG